MIALQDNYKDMYIHWKYTGFSFPETPRTVCLGSTVTFLSIITEFSQLNLSSSPFLFPFLYVSHLPTYEDLLLYINIYEELSEGSFFPY